MRSGHGGSGLQQRDTELTERQRQVLRLIAAGKTNAEIGTALGISLDGAKWHVSEILAKLDVSTREEAAQWWRQRARPLAKVGRVLRLLLTPGAWKLAAAGAAVCGIGGVTLALIWVARDDSGQATTDLPSTAAVSPTSQAPASTVKPNTICVDVPESCAFAERLVDLIRSGNVDGFADFLVAQDVECPGPSPQGLGGPFPLCTGADPGEMRRGYTVTNESVALMLGRQQLRDTLLFRATESISDAIGDGALQLYAIGCQLPGIDFNTCGRSYVAVLSSIPDGSAPVDLGYRNRRVSMFLFVTGQPDQVLRVDHMRLLGPLPDLPTEYLTGGIISGPLPFTELAANRYYPVR